MSDSRTLADMIARVYVSDVAHPVFDLEGFRSDALPDREWWAEVITKNLGGDLDDGIHELEIFIEPKQDTDPGRDTVTSFRVAIYLYYCGLLAVQDGHARPAMSLIPHMIDGSGSAVPIGEDHLASWSCDVQDMLDAYAEGADAPDLIRDFIRSHCAKDGNAA